MASARAMAMRAIAMRRRQARPSSGKAFRESRAHLDVTLRSRWQVRRPRSRQIRLGATPPRTQFSHLMLLILTTCQFSIAR